MQAGRRWEPSEDNTAASAGAAETRAQRSRRPTCPGEGGCTGKSAKPSVNLGCDSSRRLTDPSRRFPDLQNPEAGLQAPRQAEWNWGHPPGSACSLGLVSLCPGCVLPEALRTSGPSVHLSSLRGQRLLGANDPRWEGREVMGTPQALCPC